MEMFSLHGLEQQTRSADLPGAAQGANLSMAAGVGGDQGHRLLL